MSEQIGFPVKKCPFCGNGEDYVDGSYKNNHVHCHYCGETIKIENWQSRPIEDALRAELARLQEKLHDEMSQLEIATDLGNKRWIALNEIYENGEKHNANWCKRKAQEGLGIK